MDAQGVKAPDSAAYKEHQYDLLAADCAVRWI
jgi:hypothetical protein